jgi:peroxiredoxin
LKRFLIGLVALMLSYFFSLDRSVLAGNLPPTRGGKLPAISLPIPKDKSEKTYLGLGGSGSFKLSQIKAKTLIIKVFNLYCPICPSTALAMTKLYQHIEDNPELKEKIKLIGIGVGNSVSETQAFKEAHHIPFPLFPDEDFVIYKKLGEVRIPFFIALKLDSKYYSHQVVETHPGGFADGGPLLEWALAAYHEDVPSSAKK